MLGNDVLYDRKSQTGSSRRLRAALIHTVESLKYTLLMFRRDTDSGVFHRKERMPVLNAGRHRHSSVLFIVPDRVVAKIIDQFLHQLLIRENRCFSALDPISIIHIFLSTVKLGKLDDIIDQGQKSRRVFMDLRRKPFRILPGHAVFDQFRIAGDRRERGLELMGHVRRKFLPDLGAL